MVWEFKAQSSWCCFSMLFLIILIHELAPARKGCCSFLCCSVQFVWIRIKKPNGIGFYMHHAASQVLNGVLVCGQPLPLGICTFQFEGKDSVKKQTANNIQQLLFCKSKMPLAMWDGTSPFQDFDEVCFPCRSFTWWIRRKLWHGLAPLGDSLGLDFFWWIQGPFDHVCKIAVWFVDDPVMVCYLKVDPGCNVTLVCIACHASMCLSCRSRNMCIFS